MGLGNDGVRNKAVGERLVVDLKDFFGGVQGESDDYGDRAKAEGHEGAVELGHGRKGLIGVGA